MGNKPLDFSGTAPRVLLAITALLAIAALYFSYLVYDKLVEMTAAGFVDLNADSVLMPREWQVDCLLGSIFLLGVTVIHSIQSKNWRPRE